MERDMEARFRSIHPSVPYASIFADIQRMKKLFLAILAALVLLLAVLVVNTYRVAAPSTEVKRAESIPVFDSAAGHLSRALRIRTVSFGDTLPIDTAEFVRFRAFMEETYPRLHASLSRRIFGGFSYVFEWKGRDTSLAPYVLMAHLDVVPVEAVAESKWTHPSFSGAIVGDTIWGRGAVDDKGSAIAIMEAVELLLQEGFTPQRTVYLSFGHDEEVAGNRGARVVSQWFREQGIRPALVLDEGGMVDTERFRDTKRPVALVGTGEKGYVNIDLTVEIPGGHSSMPARETAIDVLTAAIARVRAKQMPASIPPAIGEMLQRTGRELSFPVQVATANPWLFRKAIIGRLEATRETNAFVHTTLVPTIVRSGIKDNVIPTVARATFNSRILPGQTSDDVLAFVRKAVADERVVVTKQTISLFEASAATPADHPAFRQVEALTQRTVDRVLVTPYLLVGATDSRYFRGFSEAVLNFTPMQDVKGFHGIDERIGVHDLHRMIHFYKLLMSGR
jgi:carboxypeptidase PM20D1